MTMTIKLAEPDKTRIRGWATELLNLEKQIKELQDAKATIYKRVRADCNVAVLDGLKTTVALFRMEPHVRAQKLSAGEYSRSFLKLFDETTPAPAPTHVHVEPAGADNEIIAAAANGNVAAVVSAATHANEEPGFEAWRKQRDSQRAEPLMAVQVATRDPGELPEFLRRKPTLPPAREEYDPETGEIFDLAKRIEAATTSTPAPTPAFAKAMGELGVELEKLGIEESGIPKLAIADAA